jgi:hypothetical protein
VFIIFHQFMESQSQIVNPKCTLHLSVSDNQKMDRRSVVLYFRLKQLSARTIHEDLVATLGAHPTAYSSVTRHLRETRYSASTDAASLINISMEMHDTDSAVLTALDETPFASIRHLSRLTHLSSATVH